MSHLANIEARQRGGRVRDALFAAVVALATLLSISTVGTAVEASSVVARR
jgi:hypothetical protein